MIDTKVYKQPTRLPWGLRVIHTCNKLRYLLAIFAGSIVLGAVLFWLIEDVSLLDGFYWAVVTATTTGYGDITPKSDAGKLLTMALMFPWRALDILIFAHATTRVIIDSHLFSEGEQSWVKRALSWIVDAIITIARQKSLDNDLPPYPGEAPESHHTH